MKKIFTLILLLSFISSNVISQEKAVHRNKMHVKKIKTINLSEQQKKEIENYKKANKAKQATITNNSNLSKQQKKKQLAKLKKEEHEKLQAILTPEKKESMKQIKNNEPRHGVTNMPNERTVK